MTLWHPENKVHQEHDQNQDREDEKDGQGAGMLLLGSPFLGQVDSRISGCLVGHFLCRGLFFGIDEIGFAVTFFMLRLGLFFGLALTLIP